MVNILNLMRGNNNTKRRKPSKKKQINRMLTKSLSKPSLKSQKDNDYNNVLNTYKEMYGKDADTRLAMDIDDGVVDMTMEAQRMSETKPKITKELGRFKYEEYPDGYSQWTTGSGNPPTLAKSKKEAIELLKGSTYFDKVPEKYWTEKDKTGMPKENLELLKEDKVRLHAGKFSKQTDQSKEDWLDEHIGKPDKDGYYSFDYGT